MSTAAVQAAEGRLAEFESANSEQLQLKSESSRESMHSHYWHRPNDRYVVVAPGWPTEAALYHDRGFSSLKNRFGTFLASSRGNPDGWNVTLEPYRRIFQRGGQDVFPVDQVLEHGWHRKAPYKSVTFPQIEELDRSEAGNRRWKILVDGNEYRAGQVIEDVPCPGCRRVYLSHDNLRAHESISHAQTAQNNAMGRAIADSQTAAIQQSIGALEGPLAQALTLIAQGQAEQAKAIAEMGKALAALQKQPAKAA